ncbi:CPS_HP_G0107460.mRNA.1.CDS.1 [Saccharomyces cerevisiae]|nr:CPS_HP_G0068460.mRNA.1.CDS.1 [Saccharomyces cerevisiae]CAI5041526.1 CPS_HP_G0107460.mRNA.1.CDS.1 [Saccharomyces cerevisiae]CAI6865262.1 CPS_HP_G0068460.mRNA.1.CDS.1 [Saccharomyces cerevisiae]CAI6955134.1 CPS_HP_G0107460.mRNA.1.CDS.1 [Saccharomyces cerevisiae]
MTDSENESTETDSLMTFDDYISKELPEHLQRLIMENLKGSTTNDLKQTSNNSEFNVSKNGSFKGLDDAIQALQMQSVLHPSSLGSLATSSKFSGWSFAQGFFVGQLSIVLLFIFFLKFFIFSDEPSKSKNPKPAASRHRSKFKEYPFISREFLTSLVRKGAKQHYELNEEAENEHLQELALILEKTYYNVDVHPAESLDWFNVLVAQIIQQFRSEAWHRDNILHSLNDFIGKKSPDLPEYLDTIKITELDTGDDFPIFSNCRIQYSPNSGNKNLEAKIDIDLNDHLTLGVETKLLLNYPKPGIAALPINLVVSIVRFQACLTVSLTNAEEFASTSNGSSSENGMEGNSGYFLMFSFSPEYRMEFEIKSLIGSRSKLENIPKIGSVIEYQIKKWFVERCVEPRFQFVRLPSMWPRSKNTREEKPTEL